MTFPTDKFRFVQPELIVDVRASQQRYIRSRTQGPLEPYWQISATTPPLEYAEGMGVAAKLDAFMGELTIFTLNNPFPQIVANTGLSVVDPITEGATTVKLAGFPVSQSGVTRAGDFFTFANSTKAYRVTNDPNSDGLGQADVTFTPPLYADVNAAVSVTYGDSVQFQVCMIDRSQGGIDASNGKNIIHDVVLIEQA